MYLASLLVSFKKCYHRLVKLGCLFYMRAVTTFLEYLACDVANKVTGKPGILNRDNLVLRSVDEQGRCLHHLELVSHKYFRMQTVNAGIATYQIQEGVLQLGHLLVLIAQGNPLVGDSLWIIKSPLYSMPDKRFDRWFEQNIT